MSMEEGKVGEWGWGVRSEAEYDGEDVCAEEERKVAQLVGGGVVDVQISRYEWTMTSM